MNIKSWREKGEGQKGSGEGQKDSGEGLVEEWYVLLEKSRANGEGAD